MTTPKRIGPNEAHDLVHTEGYVYVDVRTVPEFEAGHPAGAYNVPISHAGPGGMKPNPDFLRVMEAVFPKDTKLVVGCKMGGRSQKAAAALAQAGYTNVADQCAGFSGAVDAFGKVTQPGWQPAGLPVAGQAEPGRSWAELIARVGG